MDGSPTRICSKTSSASFSDAQLIVTMCHKADDKMKGINLGASPEPLLPPQAAGY